MSATTRGMARLITELAARHNLDLETPGVRLAIPCPGALPLTIEPLGGAEVVVRQDGAFTGGLRTGPSCIYLMLSGDAWTPMSHHTEALGVYRFAVTPEEQDDQAAFADAWADALRRCGVLEAAEVAREVVDEPDD